MPSALLRYVGTKITFTFDPGSVRLLFFSAFTMGSHVAFSR
jgi:hypothetical protein